MRWPAGAGEKKKKKKKKKNKQLAQVERKALWLQLIGGGQKRGEKDALLMPSARRKTFGVLLQSAAYLEG